MILWSLVLLGIATLYSISRSPMFALTQKPEAADEAAAPQAAAPPPRRQPNPMLDPAAASRYVDTLAFQSRGDFNRLDADDQSFLLGLAHSHASDMIRFRYRTLKAQRRQQASQHARTPKL